MAIEKKTTTKVKGRVIRGAHVPATTRDGFKKLHGHVPEGWKFLRAARTRTENHGDGVRVWFANVPVPPPTIHVKADRVEGKLVPRKDIEAIWGKPFVSAAYVQGSAAIDITLEGGVVQRLERRLAESLFDFRPARRPKLRLLTLEQSKGLTRQVLKLAAVAAAIPEAGKPEHVLIDVLLSDAQAREFFGLGDRVEVRGVRGQWKGEPLAGRGVCEGFLLRCVEPASGEAPPDEE